jgi:hypothetical protein
MNRKYIGDAKDFTKGGILFALRNARLIDDPAIVPLFTSPPPNENEISTYLACMGSCRQYLVSSATFTNGEHNRQTYFDVLHEFVGDLRTIFVDPDTGIREQRYNDNEDKYYISCPEIVQLLAMESDRILIVYDESFGNATFDDKVVRMRQRLELLRREPVLSSCFYYAGSAFRRRDKIT